MTVKILALDPSTDVTGVVLADCLEQDVCAVYWTEIAARSREENSLMARIERIAYTRRELEKWARQYLTVGEEYIVAYEYHLMRGGPASEALSMAAGAYLTLFEGREVIPVLPVEAKAAWNGTRYKREEAKAAVVVWANRFHAMKLSPKQDGIADAVAVAEAAWAKVRQERKAAAQPSLFGRGKAR